MAGVRSRKGEIDKTSQGGGPIYAKSATFPRHAAKGDPGDYG